VLRKEHSSTIDIAQRNAGLEYPTVRSGMNISIEDLMVRCQPEKQDIEAAFNRSLRNMDKKYQELYRDNLMIERTEMAQ